MPMLATLGAVSAKGYAVGAKKPGLQRFLACLQRYSTYEMYVRGFKMDVDGSFYVLFFNAIENACDLTKFSTVGALVWKKVISSPTDCRGVEIDSTYVYVLGGSSSIYKIAKSDGTFVSGNSINYTYSGAQNHLMRNAAGNFVAAGNTMCTVVPAALTGTQQYSETYRTNAYGSYNNPNIGQDGYIYCTQYDQATSPYQIDIIKLNPTTGVYVTSRRWGDWNTTAYAYTGTATADASGNVYFFPSCSAGVILLKYAGSKLFCKRYSFDSSFLYGNDLNRVKVDALGRVIMMFANNTALFFLQINPSDGSPVWCRKINIPSIAGSYAGGEFDITGDTITYVAAGTSCQVMAMGRITIGATANASYSVGPDTVTISTPTVAASDLTVTDYGNYGYSSATGTSSVGGASSATIGGATTGAAYNVIGVN